MKRFKGNPILEAIGTHFWESRRVYNAAAVYLDKRIHILYRAECYDNISRIGYASSSDGYHIDDRLEYPVFEPVMDEEQFGTEDPRISIIGNKCLMNYTAVKKVDHQLIYQISLTSIDVDDFLKKRWNWGKRLLPFHGIRNKDATLFPKKIKRKYVMVHRIEPDICLAYSDDLERWYDLRALMRPGIGTWDSLKVGAAGPPIELNEGWLFIYHGVDFHNIYRLGVALLDKDNPEIVIHRKKEPILEPKKDYERFGKVPNVVFSCGNILRDNEVLIYYGGADSVLCVATYDLSKLLPKK